MKLKPMEAFMHVLTSCKNEEDPSKNEGARMFRDNFSPLLVNWDFSDAQGQLTP